MEKVILVAIAKEEEQYLREWIDYHLNLGFDKIIIYDNNHSGDNSQKNIIKSHSDKVIYKDFQGIFNCSQQSEAYTDAWINNSCDWICFLDIDEFLDVKDEIHNFLSNPKFNNYNAINIPWLLYTDSDLVYNDYRPVLDRFSNFLEITPKDLKHPYKRIYRHITMDQSWKDSIKSPHRMRITPCCDYNGNGIKYRNSNNSSKLSEPHIKHFMFKTAEEAYDKIMKGDVLSGQNPRINLIKRFFWINKYTKEKEDILRYGKSIQ